VSFFYKIQIVLFIKSLKRINITWNPR